MIFPLSIIFYCVVVVSADHCKFCHTLSSLIGSNDNQFTKSCRVACINEWQLINCESVCEKLLVQQLTCDELPICISQKQPSGSQHSQEIFRSFEQRGDFVDIESSFSSSGRLSEELDKKEINAMATKIKSLEYNIDHITSEVNKLKQIIAGFEEKIKLDQGEKKEREDESKRGQPTDDNNKQEQHKKLEEQKDQQQKIQDERQHKENVNTQEKMREQKENDENIDEGSFENLDLQYSYFTIIVLALMVSVLKWKSEQYIATKQEEIFMLDDPMPAFSIFDTKEKLVLLSVRIATIVLCANVLGRELFFHIISFWSSGSFQGLKVTPNSLQSLSTFDYSSLLALFGVIGGLNSFIIFNESLYKLHTLDIKKWIRFSMAFTTILIALFFGLTNYKYAVYVILMLEYSNLISAILYVNILGKTLFDLFLLNDDNPIWVAFLGVAHKLKLYPIMENVLKLAVISRLNVGFETNFSASVWVLFILHVVDLGEIMHSILFSPRTKPSE